MTEADLTASAESGDYILYFLSPTENEASHLSSQVYCAALPEDLGGNYLVELTNSPGLRAVGLQGLKVYGFISHAATQEEYDMAVAMLRAMRQGASS